MPIQLGERNLSMGETQIVAVFALLLLFSSAQKSSSSSVSGSGSELEWQIITKRNFSSQIRLHQHLLLIITVPWCGESRSLMKELAQVVTDKKEKLGYLKLRVVYRNYEKMLADAHGAAEGITLFYYRYTTSYKYQGHFRPQNILSSIYHVMSLQTEDLPLKFLRTQEDLDHFFQSTDKAVLLLEFCGWSAKLVNRKKDETKSVQVSPEEGVPDKNLTSGDGKLEVNMLKDKKGLKIEELTCGVQDGPPWLGGFTWKDQSYSQDTEYRNASKEVSCTSAEFQQFKSFLNNFTKIARENFLPPERQRFGVISERSLLPFLGVGDPETWLVILQFSGCPNCSIILQEGDDLRTILQTHDSLVTELHIDGNYQESTFSADRPSVVLFIDRSSDSSKVRGDSKLALQVLRKFVRDNQLAYKLAWELESRQHSSRKGLKTRSHIIYDRSSHQNTKDFSAHKIVKVKDNMAIMIMNDGGSISLDTHGGVQGTNIYDVLTQLLQQRQPAPVKKENKISSLAKEVGFQLLSDDFELQIMDPPSVKENDGSNYIIDSTMTSLEDQISNVSEESNSDYVVDKNILVEAKDTAALDDGKQPEQTDTRSDIQRNQETVQLSESATDEELKDDIVSFTSRLVNQNDGSCKQEDLQSFTCSAENSLNTGKGYPINEISCIGHTDTSGSKTHSDEAEQTLAQVIPHKVFIGDDADALVNSIKPSRLNEWHFQKLPFKDSFFFSDGGHPLLQSLTGGVTVPTLAILDPALQQHYVFPTELDISYTSLVSFIENFLNGSLTPYRRSASPIVKSKEAPRPPFVNLDFHEADSIPRVTANTFCELIVGYKHCQMGYDIQISHIPNYTSIWKMDVLVLLSTPWCGFCQRMELIVREVYRAFKHLSTMLKSDPKNTDRMHIQDDMATAGNRLPSIYLMDCLLNDCGSLLRPLGKKEAYPALMLFPAENKTSITYEGDVSVVNIIEFLVSHGRNSHYLHRHKGVLWTPTLVRSKRFATLYDASSEVHEEVTSAEQANELIIEAQVDSHLPTGSQISTYMSLEDHHITTGSILASTDKLLNSVPFDNSKILIVMVEKNHVLQGLIINKRMSWDVLKELDKDLEPLKLAPLFYGGPLTVHPFDLVSLARKATEGYKIVSTGTYFGDPLATSLIIERIKSGDESAYDYWFFVGFCSWYWNQLFDELAAGAWYLSESPTGHLEWPDI